MNKSGLLLMVLLMLTPMTGLADVWQEHTAYLLWSSNYDDDVVKPDSSENWLTANSRVRYPLVFPLAEYHEKNDVRPEDIEYIFFFTAGQQALGSSTDSNVTGCEKGGQERLYNTTSPALKSSLQALINSGDFGWQWFIDGVPDSQVQLVASVISGVPFGSIGQHFQGVKKWCR